MDEFALQITALVSILVGTAYLGTLPSTRPWTILLAAISLGYTVVGYLLPAYGVMLMVPGGRVAFLVALAGWAWNQEFLGRMAALALAISCTLDMVGGHLGAQLALSLVAVSLILWRHRSQRGSAAI